MPMYEYHCSSCDNEFTELRPMAQCIEPCLCINCGEMAQRQISAPRLATMSAERRHAHQTNERSQHAPRMAKRGHVCSSSCNHGKNGEQKPAMKSAPASKRPWMIGH